MRIVKVPGAATSARVGRFRVTTTRVRASTLWSDSLAGRESATTVTACSPPRIQSRPGICGVVDSWSPPRIPKRSPREPHVSVSACSAGHVARRRIPDGTGTSQNSRARGPSTAPAGAPRIKRESYRSASCFTQRHHALSRVCNVRGE